MVWPASRLTVVKCCARDDADRKVASSCWTSLATKWTMAATMWLIAVQLVVAHGLRR
jgi:hypothetical protein